MNFRQLSTNFWKDNYTHYLSQEEKLTFIHLVTNDRVTMCGVYEMTDDFISLEVGITKDRYEQIKKRFEADRKFMFYKGWVYIINFSSHNTFSTAPNVLSTFEREFNRIPKDVKKHFFTIYPFQSAIKSTKKVKLTFTSEMDIVIERDMDMDSTLGGRVGGRVQQAQDDSKYDIPDGII